MSGLDLLEDGFPHGTLEGYERGCHGEICPSKGEHGWSCAGAVIRYRGDWVFRKRVDAGMGPAEIAVLDREEAEAARLAEREALKAERAAARAVLAAASEVAKAKPSTPRREPQGRVRRRFTDAEVEQVRALNEAGRNDSEIAREMGRAVNAVRGVRTRLQLPRRTDRGNATPLVHGTRAGYQRGCRSGCPENPSCSEAERAYARERAAERRGAAA